MTHRRKKLIIAIVVVLLPVLILKVIFMWGITFDCDGGFEWSLTKVFEDTLSEGQTARIRLGEEVIDPIVFIPFVLKVCSIEPPPYAIHLSIIDDTESLAKILIESISIEYVDGQKTEHTVDWERFLEGTFSRHFENGKLVKIPVMRLGEKFPVTLPVTVDRRETCNIRFVGHFVKKGGEKIHFDTTEYFEYEPRKWRIYPAGGP